MKKRICIVAAVVAGILLLGALSLGAVYRTYHPSVKSGFSTTQPARTGTGCTDPSIYGEALAAQLAELHDEANTPDRTDGRDVLTAEFTSDDGAVTIRTWAIPVKNPEPAYPSRTYYLLAAHVKWNREPKWHGTDLLALGTDAKLARDHSDAYQPIAWVGNGTSGTLCRYNPDDAPDPNRAIQFDWSLRDGFKAPLTRGTQSEFFYQMRFFTDDASAATTMTAQYTHTYPGAQTNYTVSMLMQP